MNTLIFMMDETKAGGSKAPGFGRRFGLAALNLLILLQCSLIGVYFLGRAVGGWETAPVEFAAFMLPWLTGAGLVFAPLALWLRDKKAWTMLAAAAGVLFILLYGGFFLPRLPVTVREPVFKVMTFNLHFRNREAGTVAAEILAQSPDLVGLQESSPEMFADLEMLLGETYPYRYQNWESIFSRYPLDGCQKLLLGQEKDGSTISRGTQCLVEAAGEQITFINAHPHPPIIAGFNNPNNLPIYLRLGMDNERRNAELGVLLAHLESIQGPLIMVGDYNITDTGSLYPALTEGRSDAHRQAGWRLGLSLARLNIPAWRIDYIFGSPQICGRG